MFYVWITIRCYFASLSIYIFVFLTRYSLRYLSLKLYISSIKLSWYKVYGIRFRSEIICSSYRITAIVLWAKPFCCEKLNKRDFKLLSWCFFHLCMSLYALNIKFGQTTETYSPQTFSVTAAVVAPAVVICLNSLICGPGDRLVFSDILLSNCVDFDKGHCDGWSVNHDGPCHHKLCEVISLSWFWKNTGNGLQVFIQWRTHCESVHRNLFTTDRQFQPSAFFGWGDMYFGKK